MSISRSLSGFLFDPLSKGMETKPAEKLEWNWIVVNNKMVMTIKVNN